VFATLAGLVVVADQVSKGWVESSFRLAWTEAPVAGLDAPTPILGDLVRIAKSYNDGGIFGLFGASAPILAVASLAVIALIVVYQYRAGRTGPGLLTLALGLLLGGAMGNLIDRLRFGHVIDFVDTGIGSFRFYTFNVADSAISVSVALLLLLSVLGDRWRSNGAPRGTGETTAGPTMSTTTPAASTGSDAATR
jgi:signal peptidase II